MHYQGVIVTQARQTPIVIEITEDGAAAYHGAPLIRFVDAALGPGWHSVDWSVQVYETDRIEDQTETTLPD